MSTKNNHIITKIEDGKKVYYCKIEKSKAIIPARQVPAYYTKAYARAMRWEYRDGANDGGIDCITPKGKKTIQCKVLAENPSSYTITDKKYNSKEEAKNCNLDEMLTIITDYANNFNTLLIYITKLRGDAFNKQNAIILNGDDIIKWMFEHAEISYMNCGKQFYRQVRFYKTQKRVWA